MVYTYKIVPNPHNGELEIHQNDKMIGIICGDKSVWIKPPSFTLYITDFKDIYDAYSDYIFINENN